MTLRQPKVAVIVMHLLTENVVFVAETKDQKDGKETDQPHDVATEIGVEQYMFLFLKFISSVIPSIECVLCFFRFGFDCAQV